MAEYISPPRNFAFGHVICFNQWHVETDNISIPRPLEMPCLFPFTFFFFFYFLATACVILVPQPRIELRWQCRVLTTGPPGKSPPFTLEHHKELTVIRRNCFDQSFSLRIGDKWNSCPSQLIDLSWEAELLSHCSLKQKSPAELRTRLATLSWHLDIWIITTECYFKPVTFRVIRYLAISTQLETCS